LQFTANAGLRFTTVVGREGALEVCFKASVGLERGSVESVSKLELMPTYSGFETMLLQIASLAVWPRLI
jgi:hypothetical protein